MLAVRLLFAIGPPLVLACTGLLAQPQLAPEMKRHLPPLSTLSVAVLVVDFDGDGLPDLFHADGWHEHRLSLGDGTGRFRAAVKSMPAPGVVTGRLTAVVAGDVDGDRDVDVLLVEPRPVGISPFRLLKNDGRGSFAGVPGAGIPMPPQPVQGVALADVDGDGDLDVYTVAVGQNRLYQNDGTGSFRDVTAASLPAEGGASYAAAAADFDGDGDPDLVTGNRYGLHGYRNDGAGRFVLAWTDPSRTPSSFAVGDLDGDGDLDAVASFRVLLNDGSGRLVACSSCPLSVPTGATAAVLADVDGDGDLDVSVSAGAFFGILGFAGETYPNVVLLNDGRAAFSAAASRLPAGVFATHSVAAADLDRDGDPDLVLGNDGQDHLLLNDGTGHFTDATAGSLPSESLDARAMVLADLDGDGALDLFVGAGRSWTSGQNRVWRNDGVGGFQEQTSAALPASGRQTFDVAAGDLDGDGDLDLVTANVHVTLGSLAGFEVLLNDGRGRFQLGAGPTGLSASGVALGDVDRDGDLDVAFAVIGLAGARNRLYLNDGAGNLSHAASALPAVADSSTDVVMADMDGDGDPDLYFANLGQDRLYLNDGTGRFTDATATHLPASARHTDEVRVGDLDRDGDADLLLLRPFDSSAAVLSDNRVLVNDGAGVFTDETARRLPQHSSYQTLSAELGDLDADGDLDLVVGTWSRDPVLLFLNDGAGVFHDVTAARGSLSEDVHLALALGDVDGDGDLDLVQGADGQLARVHANLQRHVDLPYLVRPGGPFQLDVYARGRAAGSFDVALPYVATGRAPAPIPLPPYGTVGIDPATAVALPPLVVLQPAGVATFVHPLPNDPALVGLEAHAQAFLWSAGGGAHLTNVARTRVVP